jgi:hypothetical protein
MRPSLLRTVKLISIRFMSFPIWTYFFLLFVHVADLEPNVLLSERPRWVGDNILEAL